MRHGRPGRSLLKEPTSGRWRRGQLLSHDWGEAGWSLDVNVMCERSMAWQEAALTAPPWIFTASPFCVWGSPTRPLLFVFDMFCLLFMRMSICVELQAKQTAVKSGFHARHDQNKVKFLIPYFPVVSYFPLCFWCIIVCYTAKTWWHNSDGGAT